MLLLGRLLADEVKALYKFRDDVLMRTPEGRWIVELYYKYSPPLAEKLRKHDILRAWVRLGLRPLVEFSKHIEK